MSYLFTIMGMVFLGCGAQTLGLTWIAIGAVLSITGAILPKEPTGHPGRELDRMSREE